MKKKIQLTLTFADIISVDNLLGAWREFVRGKRDKKDVQIFELRLMDNILSLNSDLRNGIYHHGPYRYFRISDPKPRDIHKANVRDRLVHHALHRRLYPFFDRTFISDSFSCRNNKGTHRALGCFCNFTRASSISYTKTCWILKCDVRKFFANINHEALLSLISEYIPDQNIFRLVREIVESFSSFHKGVGLPLGNLTSQLLVNIYMNEFDQFVKHQMKVKYYIRFADDFVIIGAKKEKLQSFILYIRNFLHDRLKLELHSDKVFIRTLASGVDFLGWVNFPNHRVLRTSTKRRMFRNLRENFKPESIASYFGMLRWGNAFLLRQLVGKLVEDK